MQFSENSRVWVYQANRMFTQEELFSLQQVLKEFTAAWQAHGHDLHAGYEIRYARFIILIVDEERACVTGCSIDKSVALMKSIEHDFDVMLFDRFNIAYKKGEQVLSCSRSQFEKLISEEQIDEQTIVFNTTVQTKKQLDSDWEVAFKDSWHPRIFTLPVRS